MPLPRVRRWLPVAAVIATVVGALGWLLLGFSADDGHSIALPDARYGDVALAAAGDAAPAEDFQALARTSWREDHGVVFVPNVAGAVPVRVTLHNPTARPCEGVLVEQYPWLDEVKVWLHDGPALESGEAVPPQRRALDGRPIAFRVDVPPHGDRVVYATLRDRFGVAILWRWWPDAAEYHRVQARRALADGVYVGGLLALLGYNLLLWFRLRSKDIGWYNAYLASVAAYIVVVPLGLPTFGLAVSSPALELILSVTVALNGLVLTQFARVFLDLRMHAPRLDRCARGLIAYCGSCAVVAFATPLLAKMWALLFAIGGIVGAALLLPAAAVVAWRAGAWQARYFLAAFLCICISGVVISWAWFVHTLKIETQTILMLGSMAEMLLLSLAIAERFSRAQHDKVAAQQKLVEETEQRRLIEEAYADELAIEVRERTRELEEANADKDRMLAVIGHDLRGPLTGLMRAADDAPGDFARETAQTGRALLLLIEDLVLWARLRAGSRQLGPHAAPTLLAPAVALHHAVAERGGTELVVEAPPRLHVITDLVLAQTLVRNLLANALKFAQSRVTLRAVSMADDGVRFVVGNDGPSLAPEITARIAAEQDGPITATGGLGLKLCREICRALGTKLEAQGLPGGGTEFSFVLKAVPAPVGAPV